MVHIVLAALDGDWNTEVLRHRGRHPNEYHEFVVEAMLQADAQASGDKAVFLQLFEQNVKNPVRANPDLPSRVRLELSAAYWFLQWRSDPAATVAAAASASRKIFAFRPGGLSAVVEDDMRESILAVPCTGVEFAKVPSR